MQETPDRKKMYKIPWSIFDNQGGWIEVTHRCNLNCNGCCRNRIEGDRSFEIICAEIIECQAKTHCDVMVVARRSNLGQINDIVSWFRNNIHKANHLSLVTYRGIPDDESLEMQVNGRKINPKLLTGNIRSEHEIKSTVKSTYQKGKFQDRQRYGKLYFTSYETVQ
ncbi:MAG: hypothetical protein Q8R96_00155 [Bacteroidota bacterium]|nr:hypothetical protein [Bacteroidota bacterium]